MNKFIFIVALALFGFIGTATAQETFVGATYVRINPDVRQPSFHFDKQSDSVGVTASVTDYETKNIGLTAEGSAVFNKGDQPNQLYTGLAGLTLKRQYTSVAPFVKGLAGVGILRVGNTVFGRSKSDAELAVKLSAGLDLGKGKIKYRLIEAGYLRTYFYNSTQGSLILSTGIVF